MTTFNRKTEFWKINTPPKVGPGSYNPMHEEERRSAVAPFFSSVKRVEPLAKSEIGPGSYLGNEIWDNEITGASMLVSGSPRMGPFATGLLGYTTLSNVHNPGPGTYITESKSKKTRQIPRRQSLSIDPSPASIPSKEKNPVSIGPGSYQAEFQKVKASPKYTTFSGYLSKRSVFPGSEEGPGPGEYNYENSKSKGFKFPRSVRTQKNLSSSPGPGSYEQPVDRKIRKQPVEAFGILEKRSVVLSNDPHMPIQVGHSDVPPVGIYHTENKLKTVEKMKQKFISYEAPIPKAAFNISTKRDMDWVDNPSFPGPGAYTELKQSHDSEESIPFGSKVQKFHSLTAPINPGPGSYEPEKPNTAGRPISKPLSVFSSKTPRFSKVASDNLSIRVVGSQPNLELEYSHQEWKAKQSRAYDTVILKPNISFESTANRFRSIAKDPGNPGPGHYDGRPFSVPTKVMRTSQRFGKFENYRPSTGTTNNVGPGSYTASIPNKKSFNMSGELAKVRPWIT